MYDVIFVPPFATGRVPVTPDVNGNPVHDVKVPADGVPMLGVVNVNPAIVAFVDPDAIDVLPIVGALYPAGTVAQVKPPLLPDCLERNSPLFPAFEIYNLPSVTASSCLRLLLELLFDC